ncbi:amidase family protein [Verminephrobacter eiseniae]|uniref:amidase family protein n=1 Tax=Verminephrobacter eiseniae TaxID=364317 RepID=UPI00223848E7|nr:amidase family protein [Verminephrobacter eiseniae]
MNQIHALTDLSAREAAALMARGELHATSYAQALLERAGAIAAFGALLHLDPAALHAAAAALDAAPRPMPGTRPLYGVPLAFKDNIDVAGMPTTAGSPWMAGHRPRMHAGVTQRLLDAGALVLGKTNLHEWSQGVTGHNHGFGPSRNPFDSTRITGGSSGGNAALLGLRATPVAIGTDTGGSVRVPAALCGLVGFRPTVRRWPDEGLVPIAPTFDTAGVMARCVDDCVLIDHAVAAGPVRLAATPLAGARLGVPDAYFWEAVDPPVAELARERLELLRAAGAVLVPCDLADAGALFRQGSMTISLYEILPALAGYFARHGRPFDPRALTDAVVSPDVRPLFERLFGATAITPEAYAHAQHTLRPRMQAAYRECFARHDVAALVFPTSPLTAARIGQDMEVTLCGRPIPAFSAYIRNTGPAGMAGLPALSLPMGLAANGLPAGLELTGAQGTDTKLLALALGIEAALPKAPIAAAVQELANR